MFKFAERSIDVSDDKGLKVIQEFMGKKSKVEKPDFLQNLTILTPQELELLPNEDFALIYKSKDGQVTRKFPITDEDNALVSAIYFDKNSGELPDVAKAKAAHNILDALTKSDKFRHDVFNEVRNKLYDAKQIPHEPGADFEEHKDSQEEAMREAQGQEVRKEKTARASMSDADFAIVNGEKRLFKIDTPDNVKKACAYFEQNWRVFTPEVRNQFAMAVRNKLEKTAGQKDFDSISIPECLRKYASHNWSELIQQRLEARMNSVARVKIAASKEKGIVQSVDGNIDGALAYKKLAALAGNCNIDDFAKMLHKVDVATGLDKSYGRHLEDAYASTYSTKVAFIGDTSTTFAGKTITAKELMALDSDKLLAGMLLPDDIIPELKSDPINVFNSLPAPYKNAILQLLGK